MSQWGMRLGFLLSAFVLTACDTVTAPAPLGSEPVILEAAEWDGQWFNAEEYLEISVTDSEKGLARIEIPEDDGVQAIDVQVRQSGEWMFVSVTEEDFDDSQGLGEQAGEGESTSPTAHRYLWARLKKDGDMIISWRPDPKAFVDLVLEGHLPGVIEDGSVALGSLQPLHYEKMTSGALGMVLDWENPTVLYRFKHGQLPDKAD